jgi:hypothetical protein
MDFTDVSFVGAPIDRAEHVDRNVFERLPPELQAVLRQANGLVAFRGGLHLRGAVDSPRWHSLRAAWEGPEALHALFPAVRPTDVPFGEDALGDQLVLRDGQVWRLSAETNALEPLGQDLTAFLDEVTGDPVGTLGLEPLRRFESEGGRLEPGQLLSVYPPYVVATSDGAEPRSLRAVAAADRLRFLSHLAAQLAGLPDGTQVSFEIRPPAV